MDSRLVAHPMDVQLIDRAERVRRRLPGQMRQERLEQARLRFGPLYTREEIAVRVAETLPRRFGYVRSAGFEPIEDYVAPIPPDALVKYDDARLTELFGKFLVVTPRYYEQPQVDPWIVAEVVGSGRFVVIAQWDV
jgi:hypothetical protein